MAVSKEELKKQACEAIEKNRDKIIEIGEKIFADPELGYKEFKTAAIVKGVFDELGYKYQDEVAITGVIADLKGKEHKAKIAIMGELDAVVAPEHRCANKETGAAHSCGHNAMIAGLMGVAYAFAGTGIMEELDGDISLMAVPAEEYVEIEYRNNLREQGKITFLGGKQEFIKLGLMDDIDMMIMQHSAVIEEDGVEAAGSYGSNGFSAKLVKYIGKEAHAGGAPHLGVNALNAASLGLQAVAMQRETFQDKDSIRVHPIITKGGDLVNVIPADVRIETYIRGNNVPAIVDADKKVCRAFKAGGDAVGAETVIVDLPGYMPMHLNDGITEVVYNNIVDTFGSKDKARLYDPHSTGSLDAGDVSHIMPVAHASFKCVEGVFHSSNFEIPNKETAYIAPAKVLAMSAIDLLYDGAKKALEIKNNFKAPMTKEEYLKVWGKLD